MRTFNLPTELEAVFREFRTSELSTLAKDGTPITWPITPLYQPEKGSFLITTSIGFPQKAFNIRRNPRVALFFSDPTGCDLVDPPAVLVQGNAEAPDLVSTVMDFEAPARVVAQRQSTGVSSINRPLMRYLFDWYYMRLPIYVTPRRLLWWDQGDFRRLPHEMEV